ncbi:hypothetical protein ACOMHN_061575 [Nucella lapillus]
MPHCASQTGSVELHVPHCVYLTHQQCRTARASLCVPHTPAVSNYTCLIVPYTPAVSNCTCLIVCASHTGSVELHVPHCVCLTYRQCRTVHASLCVPHTPAVSNCTCLIVCASHTGSVELHMPHCASHTGSVELHVPHCVCLTHRQCRTARASLCVPHTPAVSNCTCLIVPHTPAVSNCTCLIVCASHTGSVELHVPHCASHTGSVELHVPHCVCLTHWQCRTAPTTVDIPTAGPPRKVVRTRGEAAAETGLRYSSLALTPAQVALLNSQPEPQFVHLQGPPGTGKTMVLLLKALQWVRQGRQVVVVSGDVISRAVTRLVEAQLRSMEPAAAANIQRLCYDFTDRGFSAGAAVARLQRHICPGPVLVIVDEADCGTYSDRYLAFLREVRDQLPAVSVWGAHVRTLEKRLSDPVPSWLEVRSLQEALRCPPSVTAVLGRTLLIQVNAILPYSAPRHPEATHGPPVHRRRHEGQPGHSGGHPEECDVCTENVLKFLTMELRVGQTGMLTVVISVWTGQDLQYRDVIILCPDVPRADVAMVRRLRQGGVPVRVTSDPPSPDDEEELALAATDVVMVTGWRSVTGLERRVVVALGAGRSGWDLGALSRCSGCLYIIDCRDY